MGLLNWFSKKEIVGKEQRGTLRDYSWWSNVFSGSSTYTGERVTQDTALHQPAVFACVRVISEDVASLPIKIYSRISDMAREPINNHPIARLLHTAPNPEMSPFTFKETMTAHVLLYGNAYAEIERNNSGDPVGLWILLPEDVQVIVQDASVWYTYNGGPKIPSENILHIKGLGHDGIVGYSPIGYARETIGMSQAMEKSGGSFFANSSRPSGILSHPAKLSEDAAKRLRTAWNTMYSGSGNMGKTAILEEGMKWNSLSIPHSDAQWLEARQYALQDICRIYRMPPHMIQDLSRATYSNIESQQIQYMQGTLMPWLRRWEQEITRKLIGKDDRSIYAEFLAEEALRGNTIDRYSAYKTARESGWMSVNEIRSRENLNSIGQKGDAYIQPLNFGEVNEEGNVIDQNENRSDDLPVETNLGDDWLIDSVKRAVGIVRNAAVRKSEKVSDEEWNDWLIQQDKNFICKIEEILQPCCRRLNISEKDMANNLVETWKVALQDMDSVEKRNEACNNWAKSFNSSDSVKILIDWSKKNDC